MSGLEAGEQQRQVGARGEGEVLGAEGHQETPKPGGWRATAPGVSILIGVLHPP